TLRAPAGRARRAAGRPVAARGRRRDRDRKLRRGVSPRPRPHPGRGRRAAARGGIADRRRPPLAAGGALHPGLRMALSRHAAHAQLRDRARAPGTGRDRTRPTACRRCRAAGRRRGPGLRRGADRPRRVRRLPRQPAGCPPPEAGKRRRGRACRQPAPYVRGCRRAVIADRELLRDLAEDALAPAPPPEAANSRVVGDGWIAEIGPEPSPDMNVVLRLRLEGRDVAATVADLRRLFESAGRTAATWEVSSGSSPAGLEQELRSLGMVTNEPGSVLALACTTEPASSTHGVTVERVESDEQFQLVRGIYQQADGWSPGDAWLHGDGNVTRYLARIGGRAVATADITRLEHERAVF